MSEAVLCLVFKLVGAILMTILSLFCGFLPLKWSKMRNSEVILGVSNSFSAGLFFSVSLLHILPESYLEYQKSFDQNNEAHFPIPFLMSVLTYSAILFIEKILFQSYSIIHSEKSHHDHIPKSSFPKNETNKNIELSPVSPIKEFSDSLDGIKTERSEYQHSQGDDDDDNDNNADEQNFKAITSYKEKLALTIKSITTEKGIETVPINDFTANSLDAGQTIDNNKPSLNVLEKMGIIKKEVQSLKGFSFSCKPYLFLIALGVHGVVEGMAAGIQTTASKSLNVLLAILMHKWAEALTLGLSFQKNGIKKSLSIVLIIIFSISGPLGIIIGSFLINLSSFAKSIILSIASGTFLYICASELIVEEFSLTKHKWKKFAAYLLGIFFIALIWFTEQCNVNIS